MKHLRSRFLNSLRWQIGFILFSLLVIVTGSVITTILDANHHNQDFTAIYLATDQHKLVHKLVLGIAIPQQDIDQNAIIKQIDENISLLRHGGPVVTKDNHTVILSDITDETVLTKLDAVENQWTLFQLQLEEIQTTLQAKAISDAEANRLLRAESEALLVTLNELGETLEEISYVNTARIQLIHIGLLFVAVILLVVGTSITRERIVRPLGALTTAAQKISRGERSVPLTLKADATEVGQLISAFGVMQVEIETSQQQLEKQLFQLTKELTAVFDISQEIVRQPKIDQVLEMVTKQAKNLLNADATHLCLIDTNQSLINLASRSGVVLNKDPEHVFQTTFPQHMLELDNSEAAPISCSECTFLSPNYTNCAAAPLIVGSKKIGALCAVRSNKTPFDDRDSRSISLLANSAAIAISNTELMKSNEEKARETAVLNERDRIATELHDNIAQILSFCNLQMEQIQLELPANRQDDLLTNIQNVKSSIETAQAQLRVALLDLKQPISFHGTDFVHDLTKVVNEFRHNTGLKIDYKITEKAVSGLTEEVQRQALFIIREALNNTHRHAQAANVTLWITKLHNQIRFVIADDGLGFSPDQLKREGHYGLTIMEERARRIGGRLTLKSAPGQGTTVIFNYPYPLSLKRQNNGEYSR